MNTTSSSKGINSPNNTFPVYTHLKEIYGSDKKEYLEEKIEPIYESMRTKFRNLYNNTEPDFYIRVPYAEILLGDQITQLFDDKIVATLEKDLIICGSTPTTTNNNNAINIELFDKYSPKVTYDINSSVLDEYPVENIKYIIKGYLSGVTIGKPKNKKGINLLVNFNISNSTTKECYITTFIASFFAALYTHNAVNSFSKQSLYDLCITELNKLDNFSYFSGVVFFQLFLEKNSIGIQVGNEFRQIKIDSEDYLLICDSFSSLPPMTFSTINYWNKRKVEFKLGLALILKRYKKNFSSGEVMSLANDFKSFCQYFENNLETIFELIDIYIKKSSYKIKELREELQINLQEFLQEIDHSDSVVALSKDFFLHKRLYFLFREYDRIMKIWNTTTTSINEENYSTFYYNNKIIPMIGESNKEMAEYYECYSEEINGSLNRVMKSKLQVTAKIASDGWFGNILALGKSDSIVKLGGILTEYYESLENKDNPNTWISDEIGRYCYWSQIGGNLCFLNPVYEDFMILDLK